MYVLDCFWLVSRRPLVSLKSRFKLWHNHTANIHTFAQHFIFTHACFLNAHIIYVFTHVYIGRYAIADHTLVPRSKSAWRFSPLFDAGGCHGLQLELQVGLFGRGPWLAKCPIRVEKEHPLLLLSDSHLKVNTNNDFQSVRELRCLECVCFCLHLWQGKVRAKVDSMFDPSSIVDETVSPVHASISHTCFFISGCFFLTRKTFPLLSMTSLQ